MRPTRRSLLLGACAVPLLGPLTAAAAAGNKRLVVVLANGGWDVTLAFDPKLGEPEIEGPELDEDPDDPDDREAVRTIAGIPLVINDVKRPSVTSFFERWGSRCAVVNGVWVGSIAHDPCRWRVLTGRADARGPDVVAAMGSALGSGLPLGSIDASGLGLAGPLASSVGSVGARGQLEMLLDPRLAPDAVDGGPSPGFVPDDAERALMRGFLGERAGSGSRSWGATADHAYAAIAEARSRADRLLAQGDALSAGLVLGLEPTLGSLVDTTVSLLSDDLCRGMLLSTGLLWDTHENNVNQHANYESLFTELDRLVVGLDGAGLLDDTLVAVLSEMSRTPKRNAALGKDHWPHTSALLLGGPVRGGRALGATDGLQESLPMDLATGAPDPSGALLKYDNLVAGLLAMLDVDPGAWLPGSEPFVGAL